MIEQLQKLQQERKRLLGIDWGEKDVGVSVCDALWMIASPLKCIRGLSRQAIGDEIKKLISEYSIGGIVIGNPINMNGTEGMQSQRVQKFAQFLGEYLSLPLFLWDERWSTAGMWKSLEGSNLSVRKKEKIIDKMSASFILQGVLDRVRFEGNK